MSVVRQFIAIVFFILSGALPLAAKTNLDAILVNKNADKLDVTLKLSGAKLDYNYFQLSDPPRLVVDIDNAVISKSLKKSKKGIKNLSVKNIRGRNRVVFELFSEFKISDTHVKKNGKNNFNLSFSLKRKSLSAANIAADNIDDLIELALQDEVNISPIAPKPLPDKSVAITKKPVRLKKKSKKVIIIDAGHGGKDPGAIGYGKKKEKDITLRMAKYLYKDLKKTGKYRVYLTRDKDIFLRLSKRSYIARKYNADLFISLHADAAASRKASGLSIYTLSDRASDAAAAKLARKENKADVIAGIDLTGYNAEVKDFLINLSQEHGKADSRIFAKSLVKNLRGLVDVKSKSIRSAGFAVLKNANMASVLIEMGYITNKSNAKIMESKSFRKKLSKGIKKSIDEYFYKK